MPALMKSTGGIIFVLASGRVFIRHTKRNHGTHHSNLGGSHCPAHAASIVIKQQLHGPHHKGHDVLRRPSISTHAHCLFTCRQPSCQCHIMMCIAKLDPILVIATAETLSTSIIALNVNSNFLRSKSNIVWCLLPSLLLLYVSGISDSL